MEFKIYDPKIKIHNVNLRLVQGDSGNISLVAVDNNGKTVTAGHLLNIRREGFILYPSINSSLGFLLDPKGYLRRIEN